MHGLNRGMEMLSIEHMNDERWNQICLMENLIECDDAMLRKLIFECFGALNFSDHMQIKMSGQ